MRRRHALSLAAALTAATAAAGISGFWLWSAHRFDAALDNWISEQRAQGNEVAFRSRAISGFPLALRLKIEQPRISAQGGCAWRGPSLSGRADVWRPLLIEVTAPGAHRISCPATVGQIEIRPTAGEASGTVGLGYGGQVERAAFAFHEVTVAGLVPGLLRAKSVALDIVEDPGPGEGPKRRSLGIDAVGVEIPPQFDLVFGNEIARLGLDAELEGAVRAASARVALSRWRDEGGKIKVSRFALSWGPVDLQGSGTASLDTALRPVGSFRTSLRGGQQAIDILAQRHLIEPKAAGAAKLALFAFSRRAEDGGSVVKLPVTLRDGLFYLGPVALFRLSPVL